EQCERLAARDAKGPSPPEAHEEPVGLGAQGVADHDASAAGPLGDARGDVQVVADEVTLTAADLACVDADPELHGGPPARSRDLDRNRCPQGVRRRGEYGHAPVAEPLDDPAVERP